MSVVKKIRSPHTTGEECPRPSTGVFQATLRSALQDTGTSLSGEIPFPVGPRQPGQSSAAASANALKQTIVGRRRMGSYTIVRLFRCERDLLKHERARQVHE